MLWLQKMLCDVNQQISNLKGAMNHMILDTNLKHNGIIIMHFKLRDNTLGLCRGVNLIIEVQETNYLAKA